MIQIPLGKTLNKTIPKEAFFRNLDITPDIKNKFVTDIKKISLAHSISPLTCNLSAGEEVKEINIINIELKKQEADLRVLEKIAKQMPFKIIFSLNYEGERQVVIFHNKLFKTGWSSNKTIQPEFQGLNLDDLWKYLVSEVGEFEIKIEEELDEVIEQNNQIEKIKKQIAVLENKIQREKQFNMQVELNSKLKELRKQLGDSNEM
jgi:RNAse (barnase) inhibitor barstar